MKKIFMALLCLTAIVFSGCSAGEAERSEINVIDAGEHSLSEPAQSVTVRVPGEASEEPIDIAYAFTEDAVDIQAVETTESAEVSVTPPAVSTAASSERTSAPAESAAATTAAAVPETTAAVTTAETAKPAVTAANTGLNSYKAVNYADVRGIWISYIELSDMLTGKSESSFRSAIGSAYDNIAELGLNTVYVHVRSHGDAYYQSELFPWSKYASGTLGKSPGFDPLEIMIEEAHSRGLSFQAWINPLRACAVSELSGQSGYTIYDWANGEETSGKYVVAVNGYYYLNPAYDEVVEYIARGAAEIVANYDVDGLHIDDYFYPTTDYTFDSSAYAASGCDTVSAFRLANCDKLVRGIYSAVKSADSNALFSVSCQGSIENNYNLMYADVKKWCTQSGYLDYIIPQIYYGFNNSAQPYESCASEWNDIALTGGIPLVVGLSASKIGLEDTWAGVGKTEWITDENILARQLRYALELRSYGGICLYSYRSVFEPESEVEAKVTDEVNALKALLNE